MNSYKISTGERVTKITIDRRVREAKKEKLAQQVNQFGYNFCTQCKANTDVPIDCAHVVSVDQCQRTGRSELAWDLENIRILGRSCHKKYDGLDLQFKTKQDE